MASFGIIAIDAVAFPAPDDFLQQQTDLPGPANQ